MAVTGDMYLSTIYRSIYIFVYIPVHVFWTLPLFWIFLALHNSGVASLVTVAY